MVILCILYLVTAASKQINIYLTKNFQMYFSYFYFPANNKFHLIPRYPPHIHLILQ
uniref:Uncharacterized protein n=1 Tax=Meloidogyne enterolobii TaxID=390850 RepID=A0A6V7WH94_MELEN|nr:unnamed protein product [Meloidogyne enterolobii]